MSIFNFPDPHYIQKYGFMYSESNQYIDSPTYSNKYKDVDICIDFESRYIYLYCGNNSSDVYNYKVNITEEIDINDEETFIIYLRSIVPYTEIKNMIKPVHPLISYNFIEIDKDNKKEYHLKFKLNARTYINNNDSLVIDLQIHPEDYLVNIHIYSNIVNDSLTSYVYSVPKSLDMNDLYDVNKLIKYLDIDLRRYCNDIGISNLEWNSICD